MTVWSSTSTFGPRWSSLHDQTLRLAIAETKKACLGYPSLLLLQHLQIVLVHLSVLQLL